jgi:FkbM family methyltransferase
MHIFGTKVMDARTVVRSLEVKFPSLLNARWAITRWAQLGLRRPFDKDFAFLALTRFPDNEVFVDVGAHRGLSIGAMRIYHPHHAIVAFEPNPDRAIWLQNFYAHDPNVRIYANGLGEEQGTLDLSFPSYNNWDFDGLASFHGLNSQFPSPETIINYDPSKLRIRKLSCPVRRMDDFNLKPGFIKIDTEGFERSVIRGGLETIACHRPIILMENSDPENNASELLAIGYQPYRFDGKLSHGLGGRNTFYATAEKLRSVGVVV